MNSGIAISGGFGESDSTCAVGRESPKDVGNRRRPEPTCQTTGPRSDL